MAMEHALFIDDFPIETPIPSGFPIARFDQRRVSDISDSSNLSLDRYLEVATGSHHAEVIDYNMVQVLVKVGLQ